MIIGSSASPYASIASLRSATADVAKATERISTTLRINHAGDDPGGLAMANRLKAQLGSMVKAVDNVNAGIAVQQRVDSALTSISSTLQSMRSLATSAASGTASSSDRAGYQLAMTSYIDEIDAVAAAATWNGSSLLDGSSSSVVVQSGVGSADSTTLKLFSTLSSALGSGNALTVSAGGSSVSGTGLLTAMSVGDLTIGGVSVGATISTDDNLSYWSKNASAIAKVAAINRKTSTTNVAATVGTTTVSGSSMTTAASGTSTITLNGTAISLTLSSSDSISTNRAAVVTAINLNAGVTGVTATDSGDSTRGVILTTADGRNITIAYTGTSAAETGLGEAGTYSGSYTLRSLDGSSVTLSSVVGQNIANAGLVAGTYTANVAALSSTARSGSVAAPTTLTSGDLLINGYSIGDAYSTDDTASPVTTTSSTRASSAIAMAAAINRKSAQTNVTATANANTLTGTGFSAGDVTSIFLNGTTIAVNFSSSTSLNDIVTAINPYQGQTGVVATNNGSGITLTASDGRNIAIGVSDSSGAVSGSRIGLTGLGLNSNAAATTAGAMTFISTVKLTSDAVFTVAAGSNGATRLAALGFRDGTYGATAEDVKLSSIDISTQTGGSNALAVIDDAIDMIGEYQSLVGAQQNRLDYRATLLDSVYTTTSSAYDNIMNADIAEETANLTAAQIRVDGSTAMVAQAATITKEMVAYLLKQFD